MKWIRKPGFKATVWWITAGSIVLVWLVLYLLGRFWFQDVIEDQLILVPLLLAFPMYLFVRSFLNWSVYEQIKGLYRSLYAHKSPSDFTAGRIKPSETILEDAQKELQNWTRDRRRELEDLRRMENYRKEFLGNVSHELKTPAFSILGYLETIKEDLEQGRKADLQHIQKALSNLDRLLRIVQDLDIINRVENDALRLELHTIALDQLLSDVLDTFKAQATARGIKLVINPESDTGLDVEADEDRIRQVLNNLVENAIYHGKEGGEVSLRVSDLENKALIEITDDGPGIEKKHMNRLFERFYRVDPSRSRMHGGSGLGLAIVKHIIEAHGETVQVRSTPGLGSTFSFTLAQSAS